MIPPVLTCLVGRNLGPPPTSATVSDSFELRDLAASLLRHLCAKYSKISHNLKPRLARSCLKTFLDPKKPLGSHYGAILGFVAIGGGASSEIVRTLVVPNLKVYEEVLKPAVDGQEGDLKKAEADRVLAAIFRALSTLVDEDIPMMNGHMSDATDEEQTRAKLVEKIGEVVGSRLADSDQRDLIKAVLES